MAETHSAAPKGLSCRNAFLLAAAVATTFVVALCRVYEPKWETNDDVGMSMVAHGYGIAEYGSPNLIFSNVLWGQLVRLLPDHPHIAGYSLATFGTLLIVGTVLVFGLLRYSLHISVTTAVLVLVLMRPVLFPQFTVNAGLLMVAAISCGWLFERQRSRLVLALGVLLAFASYLVRGQEFLLVALVAIPLLPWTSIRTERVARLSIIALIATVLLAAWWDRQAYGSGQWEPFSRLNSARAPFTDFGAATRLKQRPEILARYGYSENDIDLVSKWFFVDPKIADPDKLVRMLKEVGKHAAHPDALAVAWNGLAVFSDQRLLPLLLAAAVLALLFPSRNLLAAWLLGAVAAFMLGYLGRPGVLRVYYPLVCLLLLYPLVGFASQAQWRRHCAVAVILATTAINASLVAAESRVGQTTAIEIQRGLVDFPKDSVVAWGEGFPYEAVYLPLSVPDRSARLYALGVFTLAPFSVAFIDDRKGEGMISRLADESGVAVIANDTRLQYLGTYCHQRMNGELIEVSSRVFGSVVIRSIRCRGAERIPSDSTGNQKDE